VFYKIVSPVLWIGGFALIAIVSPRLNQGSDSASMSQITIVICLFWMLGAILIMWVASRVRTVWLDGEHLIVRHYRSETRIPLSAVRSISETRMWDPKMITLSLEDRDGLPEKVQFVAKLTFLPRFATHPTVEQLQALVDQARKSPSKTTASPGSD